MTKGELIAKLRPFLDGAEIKVLAADGTELTINGVGHAIDMSRGYVLIVPAGSCPPVTD
jgi:hypothetical protein